MPGHNERDEDERWMKRALGLAELGHTTTAPNPMVGCVIVLDGVVIAEGWHEKYGEAHAEVNALSKIPHYRREQLSKATAYVTLEPCSHYGKTPPCAELLIERGVGRVVSAMVDPNDLVSGKGHKKLQQAGIETLTGVLESDSRELNKKFIHLHKSDLPFITLKWAESKDGFIDPNDDALAGRGSYPITSDKTRTFVHRLRASHKGILVGRKTIEVDDPSLTVRKVKGVNPIRIVIDPDLKLDTALYKISRVEGTTWILHSKEESKEEVEKDLSEKVVLIKSPLQDLTATLTMIRSRGIDSVLVEGGAYTLRRFLEEGLWNEAYVFSSNSNLKEGLQSPELNGEIIDTVDLGVDCLKIYTNIR